MVADALSREILHSVNVVTMVRPKILRDLENVGTEPVLLQEPRSFLGGIMVQPILLDEIKHAQVGDEEIERIKGNISKGKVLCFAGVRSNRIKEEYHLGDNR